jgi:hypothetical protein
MNRDLLKYATIGLGLVLAAAGGIFLANRGAQIRLSGSIQKVRVQAMDERSCMVIVDFRIVNPADYPFVVRDARIVLEDGQENRTAGMTVAAIDAQRVLEYYSRINPGLGRQYNETLVARTRIEPRQTMDRMISARFEMPTAAAEARRRLIVRIEDVDGAVTELEEQREP